MVTPAQYNQTRQDELDLVAHIKSMNNGNISNVCRKNK